MLYVAIDSCRKEIEILEVTALQCPSCGAPLTLDQKVCDFCGGPVVITTFNPLRSMSIPDVGKRANAYRQALANDPDNQDLNTSAAMCFLKLKQYALANQSFEKAMQFNFDNSEVFFYAAISLLEGKIPFLHLRPTIDKILGCMESALMIEPRGIYYYFIAYIKYDYFKRKYLNVTPDYSQMLATARQAGYTDADVQQLFELLGTPRPPYM